LLLLELLVGLIRHGLLTLTLTLLGRHHTRHTSVLLRCSLRLSLGLSQRPGGQSELLYDAQGKPMKRRKRDKKYDSSITMSLHSKISPVMKTNNPPFTAGESEIQKVCMTNEHCSEADILSQLERSRQEYDEIQKQKQQIERSK